MEGANPSVDTKLWHEINKRGREGDFMERINEGERWQWQTFS